MPPQFENQTPPSSEQNKKEFPKWLDKMFGIIGLFIIGYFIFSIWQISVNPIGPMPPEFWDNIDLYRQQDFKTYRSEKYGFEFKYSARLELKEVDDGVILTHQIPYKNYGDCDMIGGGEVYDKLTDFEIGFKIVPGLQKPSVVDGNFTSGMLSGEFEYYGAEGCGDTNYYFQFEDKTLIVRRANIQTLSGIRNNAEEREAILKIPGAISKQHNDGAFNEILSTFKFISTSTSDISIFCGGKAGIQCPNGEYCVFDDGYTVSDRGGHCVKR